MPPNLICWAAGGWGRCKTSLRSWTGREAGKAVVRSSSRRDKTAFYLEVWWYAWKAKKFWGLAMVCWSRKSRNLSQSMLWKRRCGGSLLLLKKIELLFMGEKHFPGFQLFNKGHLRSCAALNELSPTSEAAWVRVGLRALIAVVPPRHV